MRDRSTLTMKHQSLMRIATSALGLLIFIPMLGIIYLFRENLEGKEVPLFFILVISLLGFISLWKIVSAVTRILLGLKNVTAGEADQIQVDAGVRQLAEMTEIINALNKLTHDFQINARQLETLIQQFSTLTEMTELTAKIPDIHELLDLVLERAAGATHAKRGSILLVRADGRGLEVEATRGWDRNPPANLDPEGSFASTVLETGEPLLVEDIDSAPGIPSSNNNGRYSSPSFLIMPLRTKTSVIGVVCLSEKTGASSFTPQDQQFLTVLLGQVGYAVENARLLCQARDAAETLKQIVQRQESKLQDVHEQIMQTEKLSALGQLIAGVAHELNNPLTSVVGYTGLVLEMPDKNTEKATSRLQTVLNEAGRATRIVQNLLSFSRMRKSEKSRTDINSIVRNIVTLREYDLKTHNIELIVHLDPDLAETFLNPDQIQQVLLNLVNNAAQALPENGPRKIEITTRADADSLYLTVADTGAGIPEEIQRRIFEPFFSTKATQTNSGLGLSISAGIVRDHGGEILVDSTPGEGTRMTVRLPIVQCGEEIEEVRNATKTGSLHVENGKALVIDDEAPIAELLADILEPMGFEVETYTNGKEALEHLMTGTYDLVVSDIRMPDINGQQIFRKVQETNPENARRFIITTGDVADPQVRLFAQNNHISLVPKPFTSRQFLEIASETLEQAGRCRESVAAG